MSLIDVPKSGSRGGRLQEVTLESVNLRREHEFLSLVRRSRGLHEPWVHPPSTRAAFRDYVERLSQPTHAGYFVCGGDGALGGSEALAIIGTQPFDLVVLDIMMPEVDGYEVLRFIRGRPDTAHLPVIFLSAKSSPADIEKGFALGANHYITKPFSGHDLIRKIRLCLDDHETAHQTTG
jgi:CheY-like chemotaxis protein